MATLTLAIGSLTATVSATNTKATNLLTAYAAAIGASGTNQEKADAVVAALVTHMRQEAHRHRNNAVVAQAMTDLADELADLEWSE